MVTNGTRYTLLERAVDTGSDGAWEELVETYHRFIFHILHQLNIDRADIDDLSQQVLFTLTQSLPNYDRKRAKFRTWLSTIIRNTAFSHHRKLNRYKNRFETSGRPELFEDPTCGESALDRLIEHEWAAYISGMAMERVRQTFRGNAVEIFQMSLDGMSTERIADKTGLTVASVYTLRKRVKKRLYLEIRALTARMEP
ncbi:RNA polymerase sigma factor [Haloferula rosea]|uniref:Sigma-70 family RNA polymerase sigma factor n=1 Tax=Haloferula rosea TaxID=490093 RepID=A0A934RAW9_9BACT|nr:sigma-70 family RNA polymerase sigma factor [Haloferula rosea]MBK1825611.1 sigma-70 family RNA polymerase sigma factor [Haloferula rosea]